MKHAMRRVGTRRRRRTVSYLASSTTAGHHLSVGYCLVLLVWLSCLTIHVARQTTLVSAFALTTLHQHHHRCGSYSGGESRRGGLTFLVRKRPSTSALDRQLGRTSRFFTKDDDSSSSSCSRTSSSSCLYSYYSFNDDDEDRSSSSSSTTSSKLEGTTTSRNAAEQEPLLLDPGEDEQNDGGDDDSMSREERSLLSYLPNSGRDIPPQFRQLVVRATQQYVYGRVLPASAPAPVVSLQDVAAVLELEHRSRDVPVHINYYDADAEEHGGTVAVVKADVTATGEELDEICAALLSAAALYELPQEIALELLRAPVRETTVTMAAATASSASSAATNTTTLLGGGSSSSSSNSIIGDSSLVACQAAFCETGWSRVVFPRGLAVTPHRKFRRRLARQQNNEASKTEKLWEFSWRPSVRRKRAARAVAAAGQRRPPPRRRRLDRQEFLRSVQAQLEAEQRDDDSYSSDDDAQSVTTSILLDGGSSAGVAVDTSFTFFPQQSPYRSSWRARRWAHRLSLRNFHRLVRRQYAALKKQGRAGLVAYCFFNFAYYTVGMLWQWPRVPIASAAAAAATATTATTTSTAAVGADAAVSAVSATALLWRKAAKVYAFLYAASQIFKLPKLVVSVAAAPVAARVLRFGRRRLPRVLRNDTHAAALLIAALLLTWLAVAGVLVGQDYALLHQNGGQLLLQQQPKPSFNPMMYHDRLLQIYGKIQPV